MAKRGGQRNTDSIILGVLDVMQGHINGINTEIKEINEKLNPVCLIIKGNGVEPIANQVKRNTDWRNKMSGALRVVSIALGATGFIGIVLKILKVI